MIFTLLNPAMPSHLLSMYTSVETEKEIIKKDN